MIEVVHNIAPLKTARIKNTSNEWFDREIAEKLRLVSAIFYKIFVFPPNDSPSKTMESVLFHQKSSFCSSDIQTFVIFPFLSTLSRYKRANGSGIICDVMNWLT